MSPIKRRMRHPARDEPAGRARRSGQLALRSNFLALHLAASAATTVLQPAAPAPHPSTRGTKYRPVICFHGEGVGCAACS